MVLVWRIADNSPNFSPAKLSRYTIMHALQDQLDKAFMEEKLSNLPNRKAQSESCPTHDDEGLIIHLSPSLATTLEGMFCSVKEYLVSDGKLLVSSCDQ